MKIVWVSHSGTLGGAELCLFEATTGLTQSGHTVQVILPCNGRLAERLSAEGVSYTVVPFISWVHTGALKYSTYYRVRRLFMHLSASRNLARKLQTVRPDVVVSNTLAMPVGGLAARWAGRPHIWYIHEFMREDHGAFYDYGEQLSLYGVNKLSQRIIVNSRSTMARFERFLPPGKLRLVYCPVEVPALRGMHKQNSNTLTLVLIGRIAPGKRQEDAIRAISILANRGISVHLTLIGSEQPEYGAFVRHLAMDLGVDHLVKFVAYTDDPFSYLASTDIALVCSRYEAFGRVTVEAMKFGVPVIGADSAGTAELIQHGVNGLLFRTGDANDLAEKICILGLNQELAQRLRANAYAWSMQRFTMMGYVSSLQDIFQEVLT